MNSTPSPIELAMIAAPIFASYVARGRGSHEDAVNDARQLIEAAERPLGATAVRRISTEQAAKLVGYVSRNCCNQLKKLCVLHWALISKRLSSDWRKANGKDFYDYYTDQGWNPRTIAHVKAAKQEALTESRKRPKPRKANLA